MPGVEFAPVPQELADTLAKLAKPFAPFAEGAAWTNTPSPARSTPARARSGSSGRPLSSPGSTGARRSRSCTRPTWCAPPTGCSWKARKAVAKDFPEIKMDDANIDADDDVAAEEPVQL